MKALTNLAMILTAASVITACSSTRNTTAGRGGSGSENTGSSTSGSGTSNDTTSTSTTNSSSSTDSSSAIMGATTTGSSGTSTGNNNPGSVTGNTTSSGVVGSGSTSGVVTNGTGSPITTGSMNTAGSNGGTLSNSTMVMSATQMFITMAAKSGMREIELSALAQKKAKNESVKSFAAMILRDHPKANQELMSIATSKNITVPSSSYGNSMSSTSTNGSANSGSSAAGTGSSATTSSNGTAGSMDHSNSANTQMGSMDNVSATAVSSLQNAAGSEFDRMYMRMVVDDHEKAVALFTSASQSDDAEVRAFAVKTLPALKGHLTQARTISANLK